MSSLFTRIRVPAALAILGLYGAGARATAVTVSCPGAAGASGDRQFTVTTNPGTASCILWGTGNLSGNNDPVNQLGYLLLDKSDDATSGLLPNALIVTKSDDGLIGTFSITAPGFTDFVIGLKSGEGQIDPDWAAFLLPAGVTSGDWTISGQQRLSHVNLYGHRSTNVVPVPAAAWLLLSGVAGLGALARRRREGAAA